MIIEYEKLKIYYLFTCYRSKIILGHLLNYE